MCCSSSRLDQTRALACRANEERPCSSDMLPHGVAERPRASVGCEGARAVKTLPARVLSWRAHIAACQHSSDPGTRTPPTTQPALPCQPQTPSAGQAAGPRCPQKLWRRARQTANRRRRIRHCSTPLPHARARACMHRSAPACSRIRGPDAGPRSTCRMCRRQWECALAYGASRHQTLPMWAHSGGMHAGLISGPRLARWRQLSHGTEL